MAIIRRNVDNCAGLGLSCSLDFCDLLPRNGTFVAAFDGPHAARSSKEAKASKVHYECGKHVFFCLSCDMGKFNASVFRSRRTYKLLQGTDVRSCEQVRTSHPPHHLNLSPSKRIEKKKHTQSIFHWEAHDGPPNHIPALHSFLCSLHSPKYFLVQKWPEIRLILPAISITDVFQLFSRSYKHSNPHLLHIHVRNVLKTPEFLLARIPWKLQKSISYPVYVVICRRWAEIKTFE